MHPRAAELIAMLELRPHPEGGFYREVFRSDAQVTPADARGSRAALTTIYFLLPDGAVSRWHQVASDEVWHLYEGGPLELLELGPTGDELARHLLASLGSGDGAPVRTIAAGQWQAARPLGDYVLVGCTVGLASACRYAAYSARGISAKSSRCPHAAQSCAETLDRSARLNSSALGLRCTSTWRSCRASPSPRSTTRTRGTISSEPQRLQCARSTMRSPSLKGCSRRSGRGPDRSRTWATGHAAGDDVGAVTPAPGQRATKDAAGVTAGQREMQVSRSAVTLDQTGVAMRLA